MSLDRFTFMSSKKEDIKVNAHTRASVSLCVCCRFLHPKRAHGNYIFQVYLRTCLVLSPLSLHAQPHISRDWCLVPVHFSRKKQTNIQLDDTQQHKSSRASYLQNCLKLSVFRGKLSERDGKSRAHVDLAYVFSSSKAAYKGSLDVYGHYWMDAVLCSAPSSAIKLIGFIGNTFEWV